MNISKQERRTPHALARGSAKTDPRHQVAPRRIRASGGGQIKHFKNDNGDIAEIDCLNRDGWRLDDCTLDVFRKLRRRRFIRSENSGPYRITREGLAAVQAQLDNR